MAVVSYPTLEHVAMQQRPYPTHVLEGAETGLVLFAAAFLGHNDAIHFAEAGVCCHCVDSDGPRLAEMAQLYPDDWNWAIDDVWKFGRDAWDNDETWDVVSLDPFTGDTMELVLDDLQLWSELARKALVVGSTRLLPPSQHPDGFRPTAPMIRTAGVYWLVFERA